MKELLKIGLGLCLFLDSSYANIAKEPTEKTISGTLQVSDENYGDEAVESVDIKHSLLPNMQHIYDIKPGEADHLSKMLQEGVLAGLNGLLREKILPEISRDRLISGQ